MRIFISGQKSFGAAVAKALTAGGHQIIGVCCPESSQGTDALRTWAQLAKVDCVAPDALTEDLIPDGCDLIVNAHGHAYIGRRAIEATEFGCIGYHPSLLPRHRGKDAVRWAIKMGDPITGGSVYWLDERVDGGPIAAQDWCWIVPGMTASDLWRESLFPMGVRLLVRVVGEVAAGEIVKTPQNEAVATFEPALDPPPLLRPRAAGMA